VTNTAEYPVIAVAAIDVVASSQAQDIIPAGAAENNVINFRTPDNI